jgi:hypothetical protein
MDVTKGLGKSFPKSELVLGLIGTIANRKWQIIGRSYYEGTVSEYDDEDNCFYSEPWSFVSWNLISSDGEFASLDQDTEGYTFCTELKKEPFSKISDRSVRISNKDYLVSENGSYKLVAIEGEFSWVPSLGEICEDINFERSGANHVIEYRKLPNASEYKEIEFFKSSAMTRSQVLTAFGKTHILEQEQQHLSEVKWWSTIYFIAAVCLLILTALTFSSGKRIVSETFNVYEVPPDGKRFGPYDLSSSGRIHQISLTVNNIPKDSWIGGGVTLLDADEAPLRTEEKEFWRETGYDDEGSWDESDRELTKIFRLTEPGQYFLEVEFDPESSVKNATVNLSIHQDVWATRYVFFASLLMFGFGFILLKYRTSNPIYLIVGLAALVFVIFKFAKEHSDDD